jgi:hypothetical protein
VKTCENNDIQIDAFSSEASIGHFYRMHFYRIVQFYRQNLRKTKIVVRQAVQTFRNLYTPSNLVPRDQDVARTRVVGFDRMRL